MKVVLYEKIAQYIKNKKFKKVQNYCLQINMMQKMQTFLEKKSCKNHLLCKISIPITTKKNAFGIFFQSFLCYIFIRNDYNTKSI